MTAKKAKIQKKAAKKPDAPKAEIPKKKAEAVSLQKSAESPRKTKSPE